MHNAHWRSFKKTVGFYGGKRDNYINIASVTKTFTATVVLQLVEEGRLRMDDYLGKFSLLPSIGSVLLDNQGTPIGRSILIKDLLKHKTGLADYVSDTNFLRLVFQREGKHWTLTDVIQFYIDHRLNAQALMKGNFHYSDMNYLLLGLIIESVTRRSRADNYSRRIFKKLKLFGRPYLKYYQQPEAHAKEQAIFIGKDNVSYINTSFDWAAGGIWMPLQDLHAFNIALFKGRLFQKQETLRLMLQCDSIPDPRFSYFGVGNGVYQSETYGKSVFYGHAGFFKTGIVYFPAKHMHISFTLNQALADHLLFVQFILGTYFD